ncbi:hypothetical protein B0A49_00677 [Cryomyces minteri]|uniref:F-box domain-containing protein n=1 Tax=Cryomyces minteri TaxID=331657 RepID=A0A4U0XWA3_9PEZI|nr:hypothetical protein B0A49_00677 [Cryomyces minteri]
MAPSMPAIQTTEAKAKRTVSQSAAPSCFSALPAELVLNIASFLPATDLVDGLMRVDRATHHLVKNHELSVTKELSSNSYATLAALHGVAAPKGWDDTDEHHFAQTVACLRGDRSAGAGAELVVGLRSRPLLHLYLLARVEAWALNAGIEYLTSPWELFQKVFWLGDKARALGAW